jgi:hypothetical protein
VWVLASGAANKDLQRGAELFDQYKYAEARAAFTKARAAGNFTRTELLDLLEMTGVAAAQQRQLDAAQSAFIELLTLDPEHKLKNDYAPRVMTPFYEARRIVGEKGALDVSASAKASVGAVEVITISVAKDPLKQVRSVRFHLKSGEKWTTSSAPPSAASFPVSGAEVTWWAELVGDKETQLVLLGTSDAPRVETAPKPAPVAAAPAPIIVSEPPPTPPPSLEAKSGGGAVRSLSYAVVALAVVAGGVGGYFGWRANNDYAQISGASMNSAGVLSITEHDAYVFAAHGQQSAAIANTLFISAGALALAAVLMWIVGGP